ncbi:MAG: preprotein translocase subunit YajC [Candidatus Lightella neohaematopini]|nr:preprotein translocase subunit YajC [Candidatus Lightella neohaematopini]
MNNFINEMLVTNYSNYSQSSSNPYSILLMLFVFVLIFYFMIIRPQQKRIKSHKILINSVKNGDEVMTSGGLIGIILERTNNGYALLLLVNNNKVIIKLDYISIILPKGTINVLNNDLIKITNSTPKLDKKHNE